MSNQVSPEHEPMKPRRVVVGGEQELGSGRWEPLPGKPEGTRSPAGEPCWGAQSQLSSVSCGLQAWEQAVLGSGLPRVRSWNCRHVLCIRNAEGTDLEEPEVWWDRQTVK